MIRFRILLMSALLGTTALLNAQQAPADATADKPSKKAKTEAAADAGATKKAKAKKTDDADEDAAVVDKKPHLLVAMEFKMGRETGQVVFELLPKDAPKTVENFRSHVESGYYDGLAVHRAVKNYLVQTGDAASRDDKARERWGLSEETPVPGEFKLPHTVGAVAMARRGDKVNPDRKSDGSQFYFVLGDMSSLSGQYTVFGKVVSGMPYLKKISNVVTDSNDCPVVRVEIKKMRVFEQTGPVVASVKTPGGRRVTTKPAGLKGPLERFLERIW